MKHLICLLFLFISLVSFGQTVQGTISDESGKPLENVLIEKLNTADNSIIYSDQNGRFSIDLNGHSDVKIRISALGFEDKIIGVNGSNSAEIAVVLVSTSYLLEGADVIATWADEKTPMSFTHVTEEEIVSENLGQDVPYVLRWTPSAVVTSDAGTGIGYTGIRIRGTDPSRINVTINGIALNDGESQGVFWVDLPDFLSSADDIQILRGVGTSTQGAGAFGATINLNTLYTKREPFAKLSGSIGSFNTRKGNISFGTGLLNERFVVEGRLSKISSGGYIDRSTADLTSFYLSGEYLGEKQSLKLLAFQGHEITDQAWWGVPIQYIDNEEQRTFNPGGDRGDGTFHDNQVDDYQQTHLQAHYNFSLSQNADLNIKFNYTHGEGFFEEYRIDDGLSSYGIDPIVIGGMELNSSDLIRRRWLDNDLLVGLFSINTYVGKGLKLTIGGGAHFYSGRHFGEVIWSRYAGDSNINQVYYDNDADKKDFNLFGKTNYAISDKLSAYLDLQVRRIDYDFFGPDRNGNFLDRSVSHNFFNPKAGLFYDLGNQGALYASFAVAGHEPNRRDYTDSSPDSEPKAEKLYNTEIGFKKQWSTVQFGLNVYHMLYDDQLVLTGQLNDVGAATRFNVEDSYRAGIELQAAWKHSSGVYIEGNATLSRNKISSFQEGIDNWETGIQEIINHEDTDLSFSPSAISSLSLGYRSKPLGNKASFGIALQNKYVSKQYIDNTSNDAAALDAYSFSNIRLHLLLKEFLSSELRIDVQVNNIFGALYETNAWTYRFISPGYDPVPFDPYARAEGNNVYNLTGYYPQAGRNYMIGLNLAF